MAAYSKELLIGAYLHRFIEGLPNMELETLEKMEDQANKFYDKVGRDEFRKYASVTPQAIKDFQNA